MPATEHSNDGRGDRGIERFSLADAYRDRLKAIFLGDTPYNVYIGQPTAPPLAGSPKREAFEVEIKTIYR